MTGADVKIRANTKQSAEPVGDFPGAPGSLRGTPRKICRSPRRQGVSRKHSGSLWGAPLHGHRRRTHKCSDQPRIANISPTSTASWFRRKPSVRMLFLTIGSRGAKHVSHIQLGQFVRRRAIIRQLVDAASSIMTWTHTIHDRRGSCPPYPPPFLRSRTPQPRRQHGR